MKRILISGIALVLLSSFIVGCADVSHSGAPCDKCNYSFVTVGKRSEIAVPSPPYYPKFNGKNERGNLAARRWIAPTEADRPSVGRVIEQLTQATLDQNEVRTKEVLGGRTPAEVFEREPRARVDRKTLYSDWDAQREEILRRYSPDGGRREAAELEAMRLAALVMVKKYKLVNYPRNPEAPKVSG